MRAPKPASRPGRVSWWRYLRLFRQDIFSSQPERLYGAWMAEFRTPFFTSYLANDPTLVRLVLQERPADFPKAALIAEALHDLLGQSVFVTNGPVWERQRRIIDPAFEGGRLRETFAAMDEAARAAVARFGAAAGPEPVEVEALCSHAAADVIFRTLFSIPIDNQVAAQVFTLFRDYQRTQPLVNLASFLRLPAWAPRLRPRRARATGQAIRALIADLVALRSEEIARGGAPDDLATKIMTRPDPETGAPFDGAEMIDQVAIFFLAGHETSASALAWALWLLAADPGAQERVAQEARAALRPDFGFSDLSRLRFTRDVFREALRLYPPVPMMVRETTRPETFRGREVTPGAKVVLSPWHLHRHTRLWERPDDFDPDRWAGQAARDSARDAFIPFSAGPRVCPGAGFAMAEGVLLLARLLAEFRLEIVAERIPVPVAHLTVRAREGIWLRLAQRPR
ncbi:MAG: cytochrome P450 [Rhodobacteraceae bacterium]|nr:cytochrome P450 [Paracoccaceae bacterium]